MTSKKQTELIYLPPPSVAKSFWDEFNKIVPICPGDSTQKILRYVWGCDRKTGVGEWERTRYADTAGKYVGMPRWVLEGWQSSEVYDRDDWEQNAKSVLGEFPNNGVWDFIEYHETPEGEFLPLDNSALERVRSWGFWRSKGHKRSSDHLLAVLAAQDLKEQEAQRIEAEKVAFEFGEEVTKILENDTQPVSTSGKGITTIIPAGMKQTKAGLIIPNN